MTALTEAFQQQRSSLLARRSISRTLIWFSWMNEWMEAWMVEIMCGDMPVGLT